MSKPERKRLPWEKELVDLNKFDWLTAVGLSHWHKHSPLQLRIAIALMQHANDGNIAWPSQQTLAQYAGVADAGQVRKAVRAFKKSGAISYCRISELDEYEQAKITRQKRGLAYELEFFWAYEQLEESQQPLRAMPKQLRDGKARKQLNRSTADRSNRSTIDRSTPVHDRPPYKDRTLEISEKKAPNEEGLVSTREAPLSAYALASGRSG
ncbi:helix-turn-helix domain-containing protein [Mesorhizobium amorphae]|uniref:helix-turn-helix domain-containing protein n=1 Tax=Mesorhizobium amorphae TaxID=71433 RepID=UPI001781F08C